MKKGIIGRKIGMTQIFEESGVAIPVTLIEAGPCTVTQIKTVENDGYEAIQLGFDDATEKKLNKPEAGHFKKAGVGGKKHLKEFRLEDISGYKIGDTVSADAFAAGEKVDITGITKGRGYTGSIKRWNHHTLGRDPRRGSDPQGGRLHGSKLLPFESVQEQENGGTVR